VFAPTDEAFEKLPAGTVQALLADLPTLTSILTYHVVPGLVMASDAAKLSSARSVQGQAIVIDAGDGVHVDGATVIQADIVADNGVIHVIDHMILPK
jgi:uncharacterized surface protein with fasciclin (FAS1) repeats